MISTTLHIKNMVCSRCIQVVHGALESLGLTVQKVTLGEAVIDEEKQSLDRDKIMQVLEANGFELLDDRKSQLVEKVKNIIIEMIHQQDDAVMKVNYSYLIEQKTGINYHYLSSLFSSTQSITIEKYIILQRIERVKELLVYNELNLSQIAAKMGYSSVAHLSMQFKKVTGMIPTIFKKFTGELRKPLDKV